MSSTMTILAVRPGCKPERVYIPKTLEAMQKLVGGCIQAAYPFEDPVAIICNDEGKLIGMRPSRAIRNKDGDILDIICGTFFICGLSEDDFCSLTEDQISYYNNLFLHPEAFYWNGHNLVVLQTDMM